MFAPVMDELNRRKAVAYTHPFRGGMINMLPDGRALGITLSTETTLTIQSILYTNTATRCPDIRFIWSHGGGTAPYITSRLGAADRSGRKTEREPGRAAEVLLRHRAGVQSVHACDVHQGRAECRTSCSALTIHSPRQERWRRGSPTTDFTPADLRAIERDNALELFPRLKGRSA